jgi:hypothetical protein
MKFQYRRSSQSNKTLNYIPENDLLGAETLLKHLSFPTLSSILYESSLRPSKQLLPAFLTLYTATHYHLVKAVRR